MPPSPLEQRQWHRSAQRSVRLAVTACNAAVKRFADASSTGGGAATQLVNALLTAQYLPAMQLPAVLQQVPGLQDAARAKLRWQQQQHLEALAACVQEAEAALQVRRAACFFWGYVHHDCCMVRPATLQESKCCLCALTVCCRHLLHCLRRCCLPGMQGIAAAAADVAAQLDDPPAAWQQRLAVLQTLCLPDCLALLRELEAMHAEELGLKRQLLQRFGDAVADAAARQPGGGGDDGSARRRQQQGREDDEPLRSQLTACLTAWLVRPMMPDGRAEQLLQLLADELAGL